MRISDWSSDVCSSDLDEFCGIHYAIAPQSGSGVECVGGGSCADDGRCARRNTEAAVDCWLAHAKVDVALLSPGGSRSNQRDNGGKQGTLVPVRILPQDFPLLDPRTHRNKARQCTRTS